jgi:hypothetical protein
MTILKPSSLAVSPSFSLACVVASALPTAGALGATVVDDFTQARAAITTWQYADNFTTVQPSFMSAADGWTDARFGSAGSGILGRRYVSTNSWGASNATAAGTMAGDGQFAVSLSGGDYADNQMVAQYKFDAAIDMTQVANSQIRITGAGSASSVADSEGYGIGIVLFSNLRSGTVQVGWDESATDADGNNLPLFGPGIGYDGRFSAQVTMTGSRSLGDFTFDVADFVPAEMRSSINGMQVFQYAYGGGAWNYTATGFSIVPAPGALALLGAAGLAASRRRR